MVPETGRGPVPLVADAAARGAQAPAPHVAVVGAGIAGLATAWYLQRQAADAGLPLRLTLFESSERWGGKVLTEIVEHEAGRFVIEDGPDSFLNDQKPWAAQLAVELGLGERLLATNDAARKIYVLNRGRPVPLPDGVLLLVPTRFWPFVRTGLITPRGKLRMGMDLFLPARRDESDETLAGFVRRRLGAEALDKIAEPLLAGIYSSEAERQSILATFPRFRDLESKYGSLTRGMLASRRLRRSQADSPAGGAQTQASGQIPRSIFLSLRDGTAEITDALARPLAEALQLNTRVLGLERREAGYRLALEGPDGHRDCDTDAVVVTAPAFVAADLLRRVAPASATELEAIRHVSTGALSLVFKSADVPGDYGFGLLVPRSERRPINAITVCSTKFDGRAPSGFILLRVFFGGSRSPASMDLDDDELLRVVRQQLADLMGVTAAPLFHRVRRWERGIPQYDVGHLDRVKRIGAALPAGLFVTGSAYLGIGLPDCVRQAGLTAGRVLEHLGAPAVEAGA